MEILNKTPFKVFAAPAVCQHDDNHIVVVIKGTYDLPTQTGGRIKIAKEQLDILFADEYWGEPEDSSVRYESDLAIIKHGADVILNGSAYAPNGRATEMFVKLSVAGQNKTIKVFGDRHWKKTTGGLEITRPLPFDKMPLQYENAFGGVDKVQEDPDKPQMEERNPVGKGFASRKTAELLNGLPLPNLESPDQLISKWKDKPAPAGFGVVPRHWEPRKNLAGTYDEAWLAERSPLLPADFDEAYYSAASPGMLLKKEMLPGAPVTVINASEEGSLEFQLPTFGIFVENSVAKKTDLGQAILDTVVIEPDENRLLLTWRLSFRCHWNLSKIEWLRVTGRSGRG